MNWTFLKPALKVIGQAALDAAPMVASATPAGPLGGMLVNIAVDAIKKAHASGKPNAEKKADVMGAIQAAAPAFEKAFPGLSPDSAHLAAGADQLVEALLSLMKATGDIPKKPAGAPVEVMPPATLPIDGQLPVMSPIPATCFVSGLPVDGEITISLVMTERKS